MTWGKLFHFLSVCDGFHPFGLRPLCGGAGGGGGQLLLRSCHCRSQHNFLRIAFPQLLAGTYPIALAMRRRLFNNLFTGTYYTRPREGC